MFRLSDGEEIMTLAFFVLIQHRSMTDGRTDGRSSSGNSSGLHIARYANALVKMARTLHNVTLKYTNLMRSSLVSPDKQSLHVTRVVSTEIFTNNAVQTFQITVYLFTSSLSIGFWLRTNSNTKTHIKVGSRPPSQIMRPLVGWLRKLAAGYPAKFGLNRLA